MAVNPGRVYGEVLDMIGNTPMIELTRFDTGPCRLFAKLENQNPGGSIKDRIGLSMIEAAERDGQISPGGTLIEATAGNTGLGLALVAAQKGYRLILVVPDKMSQEKIFNLTAMGAEVVLTRSDVENGHPEYYQDKARALAAEIEGSFLVNQFANPANPHAHETGTGPEIWEQMEHDVDAVVCGVGSGGTLTGLGRFFAKAAPHVEMVMADPEGSILAGLFKTGEMPELGSWQVEGIGEDFVPPNLDMDLISDAYTVSDGEAFTIARDMLRNEGLLIGSSSGTLIGAAIKYCQAQSEPKRVVTFICDTGNKYLSKMYNDNWMIDQGFIRFERVNDLRDLITRRPEYNAIVGVNQADTLLSAYGRMRLHDVSQLPVMEDGKIIGIVDESDILLAVVDDQENFRDTVSSVMTERLEVMSPTQAIEDLIPVFDAGQVAIVMDGDAFLGLITRVDMINHLRQRLD